MAKLLIDSPSGEQKVIEIDDSGSYFDPARVLWDTRLRGEMPIVTLGKMQLVGNNLITLDDYLPAHEAVINKVDIPVFVTRRQARLALLDASLLSTINAFISEQPEAVQIFWNDSTEIYRQHPLVLSIGAELNLTAQQLDDLFILAVQK